MLVYKLYGIKAFASLMYVLEVPRNRQNIGKVAEGNTITVRGSMTRR
ncbi:hypothetical protein [Sphingobacterium sp. CZ-2]|nr:hypothetical protein [Sphingobacterium sp. CZ-2]